MGYPDNGCGRYASQLSHKAWFELNNKMRSHANLLEHLPTIPLMFLLSGLINVKLTLACSTYYLISRILYVKTYSVSPNNRVFWSITSVVATWAPQGVAIYSLLTTGV
jgi:hypothetical protein